MEEQSRPRRRRRRQPQPLLTQFRQKKPQDGSGRDRKRGRPTKATAMSSFLVFAKPPRHRRTNERWPRNYTEGRNARNIWIGWRSSETSAEVTKLCPPPTPHKMKRWSFGPEEAAPTYNSPNNEARPRQGRAGQGFFRLLQGGSKDHAPISTTLKQFRLF